MLYIFVSVCLVCHFYLINLFNFMEGYGLTTHIKVTFDLIWFDRRSTTVLRNRPAELLVYISGDGSRRTAVASVCDSTDEKTFPQK